MAAWDAPPILSNGTLSLDSGSSGLGEDLAGLHPQLDEAKLPGGG